MSKTLCLTIPFLVLASAAWAQTSANYQIEQGTFNNGGNPAPELASANYRMTLDSIGDGVAAAELSSASYEMGTGLPPAYPPPGEVLNLHWTDKDTLVWSSYPKMTLYNMYRGSIANLAGGYGTCYSGGISALTVDDAGAPPAGGYFYLVTTENSLEEGTLGTDSSGVSRLLASPCE